MTKAAAVTLRGIPDEDAFCTSKRALAAAAQASHSFGRQGTVSARVSADNSSAVASLRAPRSDRSCSQNEGVNTREVIHSRYHKPPLRGGKLR